MLFNTGTETVFSEHGLLTTVAFKFGKQPVHYALEGSIAIAGAAVTWLRDNLNIIKDPSEIDAIASRVSDTAGVYFVPAFTGLFAPHWCMEAQGMMVGLTQYTKKEHIVRATLEAVSLQTKEILNVMHQDSGTKVEELIVDGGLCNSNVLMQIQADVLGIKVHRPEMLETTALGAALAAGVGIGVVKFDDERGELSLVNAVTSNDEEKSQQVQTFEPKISDVERKAKFKKWENAVKLAIKWAEMVKSGK